MPLTALVLGGAACLEQDKAAALALFEPDLIIACNHAGRDEPGRVDHWASMHPPLFRLWCAQRTQAGRAPAGQLWGARHRAQDLLDLPQPLRQIDAWGGSSGMLCVTVAFELGAERIVLAGVPLRKGEAHYDDPRPWWEARDYWPAWERERDRLSGRVRSLSGWTRDLLGWPDREWLSGD